MLVRAVVRYFSNKALADESYRTNKEMQSLSNDINRKREELIQEKEKLDIEFKEKLDKFNVVIEQDKEFYEKIYPLMTRYMKNYTKREQFYLQKKSLESELDKLFQGKEHLKDWLDSLDKDIDILKKARSEILSRTKVSKNLKLAYNQNPDFPDCSSSGRTEQINKLIEYRNKYEYGEKEYFALCNLIDVVRENSKYGKELHHIKWAIGSKNKIRRDVFQFLSKIKAEISRLLDDKKDLLKIIDQVTEKLIRIGSQIVECWDNPISKIQSQIDKLEEEYKTAYSQFEYYKKMVHQCHNREEYDNLETYKEERGRYCKEQDRLWKRKSELYEERGFWFDRKKLVKEQLKKHNIYLEGWNN